MTAAEGKEYLKLIVFSQNSIYQYLTVEDMEKLRRASSPRNIQRVVTQCLQAQGIW